MEAPVRRPSQAPPSARIALVGLVLLTLLAGALACDTPARTPRPSPSLTTIPFTPQPSRTAGPTSTPGASLASWPVGWDVSFCAMFTHAVDAQQLLVDVQLDIADGNKHDARLLADELTQAANDATTQLGDLPSWAAAQDVLAAVAGLMDLGARAGTAYHTYLAGGKRADLRQARDLRSQNGAQTAAANTALAALSGLGLSCPGTPLVLESPK